MTMFMPYAFGDGKKDTWKRFWRSFVLLDDRPFLIGFTGSQHRCFLIERDDFQLEFPFFCKCKSCLIHDLQVLVDHFVIGCLAYEDGIRVLHGVFVVHAVDLRCLDHHVAIELKRSEYAGSIRSEVGVSRPRSTDDDPSFLHVPSPSPFDVFLSDFRDVDRTHEPRGNSCGFKGILHGDCIHDCRHHPDEIGRGSIHAGCRCRHSSEDVSSSQDDGDLDAAIMDLLDLQCEVLEEFRINPVMPASLKSFSRDLQ